MASDSFQGAQALAAAKTGPYGVTVTLPQIPLWLPEQARQALEGLVRQTMSLALQSVSGYVSGSFSSRHNNTGVTAQSFTANPSTPEGGLELLGQTFHAGAEIAGRVFSSLPQAVVLEDGRRPGAPISRAGIDSIGLWAQRKLGLSAEEASHAKWGIAAHIVAQGIQGSGYFEAGVQQAQPTVEHLFAALSVAIGEALTTPAASGTRRRTVTRPRDSRGRFVKAT